MSLLPRAARLFLFAVVVLAGCGGGSVPPHIDRFEASAAVARSDVAFELVAVFDKGVATIDQGVGEVHSGVPVQVRQIEAGHYTLTVTDSQGRSSTASLDVPMAPRMVWSFDTDQPGWTPMGLIHDGMLDVSAYQGWDPENGGTCADNYGHLTVAAPELIDGRYPHADFVLDTPRSEGDITITYAGRSAKLLVGSWTPERILIQFDHLAGTAQTYVDGVLRNTQPTTRVADQGTGIDIHVHACSPDMGDTKEFFLNELTIEAY